MKILIAFTAIVLCSIVGFNASAQSVTTPAMDTLTNVDTSNMVIKIPGAYNDVLTFQLNVVKLTGTTAGTSFVQGSLDGVNYITLPGTDTLTLPNASTTKVWVLPKSQFLWYRVRTVGTGTQSTQLKGLVLFR